MIQGLLHLLYSCHPSSQHPAPFLGRVGRSGAEGVLEMLEVVSEMLEVTGVSRVLTGACWKVLPSPRK